MIASRVGCQVMAVWLVDQGADMDKRDTQGWSTLMFSVDRGSPGCCWTRGLTL